MPRFIIWVMTTNAQVRLGLWGFASWAHLAREAACVLQKERGQLCPHAFASVSLCENECLAKMTQSPINLGQIGALRMETLKSRCIESLSRWQGTSEGAAPRERRGGQGAGLTSPAATHSFYPCTAQQHWRRRSLPWAHLLLPSGLWLFTPGSRWNTSHRFQKLGRKHNFQGTDTNLWPGNA